MAQEAEALREKRARIIKAEAELEATQKLKEAAGLIMENTAGLELRRMQMITEVGAKQNTTTIIMMPSEFVRKESRLINFRILCNLTAFLSNAKHRNYADLF